MDTKRLVIAVALSMLIMVSFQSYMAKRYPAHYAKKQPVNTTPTNGVNSAPSQESLIDPIPSSIQSKTEALVEEERVEFETRRFLVTFSNIGGSIADIKLKEFTDNTSGEPISLFNMEEPIERIGAISGLISAPTLYQAPHKIKVYGNEVICTAITKEGLRITKRYIFTDEDTFWFDVKLKNEGSATLAAGHRITIGSNILAEAPIDKRYVEVDAKVAGKILRDKKVPRSSSELVRGGVPTWVAYRNKYFSGIILPGEGISGYVLRKTNGKELSLAAIAQSISLTPYGEVSYKHQLYVGPNSLARLTSANTELEGLMRVGMLGGVSKILLSTLHFFHRITNNWGGAILLLTLMINIVLSPLTIKSFKSMRKMQQVQPHLEQLRKLHKDNPQKLNKEMMELYKKYKINPMGGCFPMLLQMPVFIALYQTLMKTIELRGANFLWIKDLSLPDAAPLPFSLPVIGNHINILPLLMMGGMFFQQKLSQVKTAGQSEQQKQQQSMMLMMPLIFGVIFYNLPSGLVLYWLTNTVLMMLNQQFIIKRITADSIAEVV